MHTVSANDIAPHCKTSSSIFQQVSMRSTDVVELVDGWQADLKMKLENRKKLWSMYAFAVAIMDSNYSEEVWLQLGEIMGLEVGPGEELTEKAVMDHFLKRETAEKWCAWLLSLPLFVGDSVYLYDHATGQCVEKPITKEYLQSLWPHQPPSQMDWTDSDSGPDSEPSPKRQAIPARTPSTPASPSTESSDEFVMVGKKKKRGVSLSASASPRMKLRAANLQEQLQQIYMSTPIPFSYDGESRGSLSPQMLKERDLLHVFQCRSKDVVNRYTVRKLWTLPFQPDISQISSKVLQAVHLGTVAWFLRAMGLAEWYVGRMQLQGTERGRKLALLLNAAPAPVSEESFCQVCLDSSLPDQLWEALSKGEKDTLKTTQFLRHVAGWIWGADMCGAPVISFMSALFGKGPTTQYTTPEALVSVTDVRAFINRILCCVGLTLSTTCDKRLEENKVWYKPGKKADPLTLRVLDACDKEVVAEAAGWYDQINSWISTNTTAQSSHMEPCPSWELFLLSVINSDTKRPPSTSRKDALAGLLWRLLSENVHVPEHLTSYLVAHLKDRPVSTTPEDVEQHELAVQRMLGLEIEECSEEESVSSTSEPESDPELSEEDLVMEDVDDMDGPASPAGAGDDAASSPSPFAEDEGEEDPEGMYVEAVLALGAPAFCKLHQLESEVHVGDFIAEEDLPFRSTATMKKFVEAAAFLASNLEGRVYSSMNDLFSDVMHLYPGFLNYKLISNERATEWLSFMLLMGGGAVVMYADRDATHIQALQELARRKQAYASWKPSKRPTIAIQDVQKKALDVCNVNTTRSTPRYYVVRPNSARDRKTTFFTGMKNLGAMVEDWVSEDSLCTGRNPRLGYNPRLPPAAPCFRWQRWHEAHITTSLGLQDTRNLHVIRKLLSHVLQGGGVTYSDTGLLPSQVKGLKALPNPVNLCPTKWPTPQLLRTAARAAGIVEDFFRSEESCVNILCAIHVVGFTQKGVLLYNAGLSSINCTEVRDVSVTVGEWFGLGTGQTRMWLASVPRKVMDTLQGLPPSAPVYAHLEFRRSRGAMVMRVCQVYVED